MGGLGVIVVGSDGRRSSSSSSSSASRQNVTISLLAATGLMAVLLVAFITLQPHPYSPASPTSIHLFLQNLNLPIPIFLNPILSNHKLPNSDLPNQAPSNPNFDAVGVAEWMPKLEPFEPPPSGSGSFFEGHSEEEVMRYMEMMSAEFRNPAKRAGRHSKKLDQLDLSLRSAARDEFRKSARQLANRPLLFGGPCPSRNFVPFILQLAGRFSLGVLPWKPRESKFFLHNCHFDQLSNQIHCLLKSLLLAGLLNRTLLIDMTHSELQEMHHYNRSLFFDIEHFRHCLGESVLMTTDEYRQQYGQEVKIDESIIWMTYNGSSEQNHTRWIPSDIVGVPEKEVNFWGGSLGDFLRTFGSSKASILHFGDLFNWRTFRGAGLLERINDVPFIRLNSSKCFSLVQPTNDVFEAAKNFVLRRMNLRPFVCVHWRRGDFVTHCNGEPDCFVSASNLSQSLHHVMAKYNIRRVVLITNADSSEIKALESELFKDQNASLLVSLRRVHLPSLLSTNKYRDEFFALVEKIVCAMSTIFLSNRVSTFSNDISRYRIALKTANCLDSTSWHK